MAALRIASDIERIGDYAANVAKRSMALNLGPRAVAASAGSPRSAAMAADMVREVLEAYRARDAERARAVRAATPNWMTATPRCSASC
jgi:phosphate transport system protein